MPIVGYRALSEFTGLPYKSQSELVKMTPEEGVEFLYGKVMPGIADIVSNS